MTKRFALHQKISQIFENSFLENLGKNLPTNGYKTIM